MNHPLYSDDTFTGQVTEYLIAIGDTIFQTHRLAPSERDHVAKLLDFFMPPQDATILDLGCGVGGFASIASKIRPDLKFILLNQSQAQLDLCPDEFPKICGPFSAAKDVKADAVTMQYALGHSDPKFVFRMVSNILPAGGIFFIYDLVRMGKHSRIFQDTLYYLPYRISTILQSAQSAKLTFQFAVVPQASPERYIANHMPQDQFDNVFMGIAPMALRFIK